jgi:DNA invertase Pin-like site-specific DNA recombinase
MTQRAVLYARVSDPRQQDAEDKASIDQQLTNMQALCERMGWHIVGEFVDREYYRATQSPKKGKMVNPSGERADRPQFLAMLKVVKTGDVDVVLCWRDDRLVRHPRVAVALEDALDIGDTKRNSKGKIEVRDATGAMIDRFTLSIKATIWREENKRRAERTKMGRVATLKQGRWPGSYQRLGYQTRKGEGRGLIIERVDSEAEVVRTIHKLFDSGMGVREIRRYLIHGEMEQKGDRARKHEWQIPLIYKILEAEDYTGIATWNFQDGTSISVEIPVIVPRDLWERNQARIERNKELSTRNAKGVYLLQGIGRCGDCNHTLHVQRRYYYKVKDGRKAYKMPVFYYYCTGANIHPEEPHPYPRKRYGPTLDWLIWRQIVDYGIKQPNLIREQVLLRQEKLQAQGDSVEGDIAHARRRLAEVDSERAFYQRQAARSKMTEAEFDARMDETEETHQYWQSELERLKELRDNTTQVQAGLDYATELLTTLQAKLPEIDIPPRELKALPVERINEIMKIRQGIVRALVDEVLIYANRQVKIEGLLDGSEGSQFELPTRRSQ